MRGRRALTVFATAAALALTPAVAAHAAPAPDTSRDSTEVSYRGHEFTVPADWQVIDLAEHPGTCVRFDRHAVYLGTPGAQQDCPSKVLGRTEALLLQPADEAGESRTASVTRDAGAHRYRARAERLAVTATYGSDEQRMREVLRSAGLPVAEARRPAAQQQPPAALAVPEDATSYQGKGFDACTAPSGAAMDAWNGSSGYGAVGVYVGGENRGCDQPNLTASWVESQYEKGWRFFPIYVGPQAEADAGSCQGNCSVIQDPVPEGAAEARTAVQDAAALGLGEGSVLYYNMEAYSRGGAVTETVLAFLESWTNTLHELGYRSGAYGSVSSLVADLVDASGSGDYTLPDVIDFARWDEVPTTDDPDIPAALWADHQRIKQYQGGHDETHGSVTINIDSNQLDVGEGSTQPPEKKETELSYTGDTSVANGSSATLSATLTDENDERVTDREVSFSLGSGADQQTCEGSTNDEGEASCTVESVEQPLTEDATVPVAAEFAGDEQYKPSKTEETVKLQYVTGRAFGLSAEVSVLGLPLSIDPTPDTGEVRTAGAGTTQPPCAASAGVLVLSADTLCAKVETTTGPSTAESTAGVEEASIGLPGLPVIGISGAEATARSSCESSSGSVGLTLTVAGQPIEVTDTPNVSIDLGVAKLVVNEQQRSGNGITVNAVHLTAPGGVDVLVASSTAAAHNCG